MRLLGVAMALDKGALSELKARVAVVTPADGRADLEAQREAYRRDAGLQP